MAWPVKEKILILWCLTDNLIDDSSRGIWNPTKDFFESPWAPLTYFNDGGVRRIFLGLTFWPKGIFLGLWKTPDFFGSRKQHRVFFWVLYFSSAQINNNISAIYSFVFDQNQSWSWHVLAFQNINNKICCCKNTEGFFWVCWKKSRDFFG